MALSILDSDIDLEKDSLGRIVAGENCWYSLVQLNGEQFSTYGEENPLDFDTDLSGVKDYIVESIIELYDFNGNKFSENWNLKSLKAALDAYDVHLGREIWIYWIMAVENYGDEVFRSTILPNLPDDLRCSYKSFCRPRTFGFWDLTVDEYVHMVTEVVTIRTCDPELDQWGPASIANWYAPNVVWSGWQGLVDENKLGGSLHDSLVGKVKKDYRQFFQNYLLPYFPNKWRMKYKSREVYRTGLNNLTFGQIAALISSLELTDRIRHCGWTFGSLTNMLAWNGEEIGKYIFDGWRKHYEGDDCVLFEAKILPLLPEEHRSLYGRNYLTPGSKHSIG